MYNIYIQTHENKIITCNAGNYEITSEGWHLIYSGTEEEAPNFFPKGLMSSRGGKYYAYINGEVIERSPEEIAAEEDELNPIDNYNPQDDTDAMLVDLEYRLTLLELGITESEVAE